jgi:hypothetical protein
MREEEGARETETDRGGDSAARVWCSGVITERAQLKGRLLLVFIETNAVDHDEILLLWRGNGREGGREGGDGGKEGRGGAGGEEGGWEEDVCMYDMHLTYTLLCTLFYLQSGHEMV